MIAKKRISFVLIIFLFLSIQSVVQASVEGGDKKSVSKKALKLMKKASKEMKAKKVDKAMEIYKEVIDLEPAYAQPHLIMGQIFFNQKNYEESASYLEKAVNLKPNYTEAIDLLARTLYMLGQSRINAQKLKEANTYFQKIIEIKGIKELKNPIFPKALFFLGSIYSQLKDFNKSNEFFLKLIQIPDIEKKDLKVFAMTNFKLGTNMTQLNKHEEAQKYLVKYLVIQTENPTDQYIPIANLILGMNSYKLLEKKIEELKKDKNIKNLREKIAVAAEGRGEIETYLAKAIDLRPDIEQAYVMLGNYYYYDGNSKKSLETYKKLVEKFPSSNDISTYQTFIDSLMKELSEKKK